MAKRAPRRETEVFSISFLDCITCGLGSVVLLLVLSDVRSPQAESEQKDLQAQMVKLKDEIIDITSQKEIVQEDLKSRQIQLSEQKMRVAQLQGDLSAIRGKFNSSKKEADADNE